MPAYSVTRKRGTNASLEETERAACIRLTKGERPTIEL
jgi:hypothetical protein